MDYILISEQATISDLYTKEGIVGTESFSNVYIIRSTINRGRSQSGVAANYFLVKYKTIKLFFF